MVFPDVMHPGKSGDADGALSSLVFGDGSGNLETHSKFYPDAENE